MTWLGHRILASLAVMASFGLAVPAIHAAPIEVVVDQAKLAKLPDQDATIVIGNPLIADVALQPGGVMVVTGKGYGSTNIVVLDRKGGVLLDQMIEVRSPKDNVVVYRGVERDSYSCAPTCEKRIMLGDGSAFFDGALSQANTLSAAASGAATSK